MPIELFHLHVLKNTADGNTSVAAIPSEVQNHVGCKEYLAYLSSRSLRHILSDHPDLDMLELLHLPDAITNGMWVSDRDKPHMAVFIYRPLEGAIKYVGALKVTGNGYEPYVSSFYRIRDRDIQRKLKRGDILREHL